MLVMPAYHHQRSSGVRVCEREQAQPHRAFHPYHFVELIFCIYDFVSIVTVDNVDQTAQTLVKMLPQWTLTWPPTAHTVKPRSLHPEAARSGGCIAVLLTASTPISKLLTLVPPVSSPAYPKTMPWSPAPSSGSSSRRVHHLESPRSACGCAPVPDNFDHHWRTQAPVTLTHGQLGISDNGLPTVYTS